MSEELRERARTDLLVRLQKGRIDPVLWEHADRVACACAAIAAMPGIFSDDLNTEALQAAALYHDSGWQVQYTAGQLEAAEILLRPTSDLCRELGADWMMDRLDGIVPPGTLQLAARIIRESSNRRTQIHEAKILADAENLEDIGPQCVALLIRRQIADGKSLADLVASWKRQEEYHYWQARLKDGFHFPQVRQLAEQRCAMMRRFMLDLVITLTQQDFPSRETHHANAS
jgi:HD superfamily phosphodiesterase